MEPDWGDFRVVLALAESGSVAGAARALQLDTSTISRRLVALEEAIGAPLFLRSPRGLTATREGEVMTSAAREMAESVRKGCLQVKAARQGTEGHVRITTVNSLVAELVPVLGKLKQDYPKLHVEVLANDEIADLARGEADIALRMVRPSELDLVTRQVSEYGWGLYAPPSYIEKHGMLQSVEDLRQHRLVPYSEKLAGPAMRWFETFLSSNQSVARAGSPESACAIALASDAIALLPIYWADQQAAVQRIFEKPVHFNTVWLAMHESAKDAVRIRVVADALVEFLEDQRETFSGRKPGAPYRRQA